MAAAAPAPALVTEARCAQRCREYLEGERILDVSHRVQKLPDGTVALPVLEGKFTKQHLQDLRGSMAPGTTCILAWIKKPVPSKASRVQSPAKKLCGELQHLVARFGGRWSEELEHDLPHSWQRHGDLVMLSKDCFKAALWDELGPELWETVASSLRAQRLAKQGRVSPDGVRTPIVSLLLGHDGWVEHMDNGIRYTFDVTRCMFSSGNITEKLRVASLQCPGEVLVDLYAGIGYFTLPFLVHAGVAFVHACEWNPHAVEALRRNLELNGVRDRCWIHPGDNRQLELQDVADRVNLGLIPSSEQGWPIACQVLRKDTGGILHIHQNVESFPAKALQLPCGLLEEQPLCNGQEDSGAQRNHRSPETADVMDSVQEIQFTGTRPEWQRWAEATGAQIRALLEKLRGEPWRTNILHIEPVKSYAPHVHHLVLDLECRPLQAEPH
ncbi:PREDICTED: tRNA wybutosine-synthesizing protein 2 homolog [Gavialis gangeticus]|uniref:tRNA wybutosine-synthesizing protein 2 homolog n=1 Tax=Gavialis gangeticus TaxID=94835 RepID=UPI00092ECA65|nr:PREDICTED: tRNA wybutosine-synthesizing protein 2 homolog [Gavialis gangeticus]